MTHKDLTDELSKRTGQDAAKAGQCLDTCAHLIVEALAEGNSVSLQGFGNFELKEKGARKMFNPATKTYNEIPAKWTAGFRPSSVLKERFKAEASDSADSRNDISTQEKG